MSKLKNLIPKGYKKKLDEFSATNSLQDFLDALSIIAPNTTQDAQAVERWEKSKHLVLSEAPLIEILNWLAHYQFESLPTKPEAKVDHIEVESKTLDISLMIYNMMAESDSSVQDFISIAQEENPVYGKFVGVLPFLKFSEASGFGVIHESAVTIGKHMDVLYPKPDEEKNPTQANQKWLSDFIFDSVLPWVIDAERKSDKSKHSDDCLNKIEEALPSLQKLLNKKFVVDEAATWEGNFSPEKMVYALPHLPQEMFDTAVEKLAPGQFPDDVLDSDAELFIRLQRSLLEMFDIISSLPIKSEHEFVCNQQSSNKSYGQLMASIDPPVMSWAKHAELLQSLFCEPKEWPLNLINVVRDEPYLIDGTPYGEKDLKLAVERVMDNLAEIGSCKNAFQPTYEQGSKIGDGLWYAITELGINISRSHASYLLPGNQEFGFGDLEDRISSWFPFPTSLTKTSSCTRARRRSVIFAAAIDSAGSDGFYALESALTAYYLLTQILLFQSRPGIYWGWLTPHLHKKLKADTSGLIQTSVQVSHELLKEFLAEDENTIDSLCLEPYIDKTNLPASLNRNTLRKALDDLRKADQDAAREALTDLLGPENWLALDEGYKQLLLDAEKDRLRAVRENMIDSRTHVPSRLVSAYFLFFEKALTKKYDDIVGAVVGKSSSHHEKKRYGVEGDFGKKINILRGKYGEGREILSKFESLLPHGLKDRDLLKFLDSFRFVRNDATHQANVTAPEFHHWYSQMTDQGVLRRFIEDVLL